VLGLYIVDDELLIRQGIAEDIAWESEGIRVIGSAESAEDALEDLEHLSPQIMLVDIEMPRMNGLQLIAQVRKLYPSMRCIVLSGYDKFDYAQEAIRNGVRGYLLKPVKQEELIGLCRQIAFEIHQEQAARAHRQYLEQAVQGIERAQISGAIMQYLSGEISQEALLQLAPQLGQGPYTLWAMRPGSPITKKQCEDMLSSRGASAYVSEHMSILMILLHGALPTEAALEWACSKGQLLVSPPLSTLENAAAAYARINECLWNGFYISPGRATDLPQKAAPTEPLHASLLWDALLHRSQAEATELLVGYLDTYAAAMENPDMLFIQCAELLGQISQNIQKQNGVHAPLQVSELCASFQSCESFGIFRKQVLQKLEELYALLSSNRQKGNDVILQTQQYIHLHYAEPLSLNELAKRFYMNPSYFSTLFYKRSGVKLHEYIRNIRLEKACHLLQSTDLTVASIAMQVGYENYRRFCTLFQENFGMTAQTWRRAHAAPMETEK